MVLLLIDRTQDTIVLLIKLSFQAVLMRQTGYPNNLRYNLQSLSMFTDTRLLFHKKVCDKFLLFNERFVELSKHENERCYRKQNDKFSINLQPILVLKPFKMKIKSSLFNTLAFGPLNS